MISQIFAVIQLLLQLFKLWERFGVYVDDQREKARIERDQKRDAAVDAQKGAKDEAEFDKAQDDIAGNHP